MARMTICVTILAETQGDRKTFFSAIEEENLGVLGGANQPNPQVYIYTFLLQSNFEWEYVRDTLSSRGVFVLKIDSLQKELIWRNKKYGVPFKQGSLGVKANKQAARRRRASA